MNRDVNLAVSGNRWRLSLRRRETGLLDRTVFRALLLAVGVTAVSGLAGIWWLPELLTHFRPHLAAGALLLGATAAVRRHWLTAALGLAVAVANGSVLLPYVVPGAGAAPADRQHLRLMSANVSFWSSEYGQLREAVRQEDPDVLGLVEVTGAWMAELDFLRQRYPYAIVHEEEGAYGLALFSRLPLEERPGSPYMEGGFQTAIVADLEVGSAPVTLLLAHLRAPTTPEKARLRNEQLRGIAQRVRADANAERILVGDLNITQWSPHYRTLESDAALTNAALGRGYVPTWPVGLGPLKIPIDHCLVSGGLTVQSFRTGPGIGSDHLPIVADIALAAEQRDRI